MSVVARLSSAYLTVRYPIFSIFGDGNKPGNEGQTNDTYDIGFFGSYWNGSSVLYTGIFRDTSDTDKAYVFYDNLQTSPDIAAGIVNTTDQSFQYASIHGKVLKANSMATSVSADTGSIIAKGGVGVAENLYVGGDLTVLGANVNLGCSQLTIYDNILVDNASDADGNYAGDDSGYVSLRVPINIINNDTPKVINMGLSTNFAASDVKITVSSTTLGNDYFTGWVIQKNTGEVTTVIKDTDNKNNTHTFTLENAFGTDGVAGTTTFDLYNKSNVGWIWDESTGYLSAYAFPRDGIPTIDPSATNGSAPEYANVVVGNLTIRGILSVKNTINALTIYETTILTREHIDTYQLIYISTELDVTIYLPDTSQLDLINIAYTFTIANIGPSIATISKSGNDTIEDKVEFIMSKRYDKIALVSFNGGWLIK
jgi:hypothetical protein